jgi:8-oxo-dGTP pyrophosphatase MutT (NUDIX family)
MLFEDILKKIQNFPVDKLPGVNSHSKLYPQYRFKDLENADKSKAKKSAVLILLYPQNGDTIITLIKRPTDDSHHSGQIAFPGGKYEEKDKDLSFTALREAFEETGIPQNEVKIIKELSDLFIPVSNFLVKPFVGFMTNSPEYTKNDSEVDEIFTISVSELINSNIVNKEISIRDNIIEVPLFEYKNYNIWGATAMIISELKDIIEN